MNKIEGEAKLTFFEASSIIVGHGVGAGILSVPYLAAHNSLREILLAVGLCYLFNLVLHLIIAELSYNNGGASARVVNAPLCNIATSGLCPPCNFCATIFCDLSN